MERTIVKLVCSGCQEPNYSLARGKKSRGGGSGGKLEIKKFRSRCRKHTVHKEKR